MKLLGQPSRFIFVGIINTIVGYSFYCFFLRAGLPYYISYIGATIIGVINSYVLNKYITFRQPQKSYLEVVRFVLVYLISIMLSYVILYVGIEIFNYNDYLVGAVNVLLNAMISWVGHKYYSFKNRTGNQ